MIYFFETKLIFFQNKTKVKLIFCPRSTSSNGFESTFFEDLEKWNSFQFSLGTNDLLLSSLDILKELEFVTRLISQRNGGKFPKFLSPSLKHVYSHNLLTSFFKRFRTII